mmetsp:Transcript_30144/g.82845  ORF Transcript_30144/g.82845 Transcript_30144/m.82845 type:complete len:286 (-) Transcript_30144:58-915(-)
MASDEGFVLMFSGCTDAQTSADVKDTSRFGIPAEARSGGAGGAMTSSLIKAMGEMSWTTYARLLKRMRRILKDEGYKQRPMLSTNASFWLNLHIFGIRRADSVDRYRGVLIGINYTNSGIPALSGCQNDVWSMMNFMGSKGYAENHMRILLDDGQYEPPTKRNILSAMEWLVEGAQAGDTLFLHYSGHGVNVRNSGNADAEASGQDQAIVPLDAVLPVGTPQFEQSIIRDDDMYNILVKNLPKGVKLLVVCDCCHSGSMLDLPYTYPYIDETDVCPCLAGALPSF